jgi:AAA-like domain
MSEWEKFVRKWAIQKILIPNLLLSNSLDEREIKAILALAPEAFCDPRTAQQAAEAIYESERNFRNHLRKIYNKCSSLDEFEGRDGKDKIIINRLSRFFYENARVDDQDRYIHPYLTDSFLESPEEVVPIDSRFYMEPTSVLRECEKIVARPRSLLRIQAPRKSGKTSLLARICKHAENLNYRVVRIDLRSADLSTLDDLNLLLKWLSQDVCRQLKLSINPAEHWDQPDAKKSCEYFFEDHLLNAMDSPLVLSLDNLEVIFTNPKIGHDVCMMLRSWNENQSKLWQNMRIIILHTWHIIDVSSGIRNSALQGVGSVVEVPRLTINQVSALVRLYALVWSDQQINSLVDLVGLDPFLIRLSLDRIAKQETSLETIVERGHLPDGLFREHLRKHWNYLQQSPELLQTVQNLLREEAAPTLEENLLSQLRESGLIEFRNGKPIISNQLYKSYFHRQLQEK